MTDRRSQLPTLKLSPPPLARTLGQACIWSVKESVAARESPAKIKKKKKKKKKKKHQKKKKNKSNTNKKKKKYKKNKKKKQKKKEQQKQ
eukprot:NODE_15076_length_1069_cov_6.832272.p5 GENE.NODE_15076_length_1069_cov_6.832272~~NODE_15076_length_1069_cov_6.832272.p5  ORF type:complete len:89 (-),score=56.40 NODE_15076_length_1069_cov_6.832272:44-310(-)